ncbi:hypothetical protein BG000_000309 [Podila horticola]|nr:hypothetical protein BG000_000309 [Podila horticola]
MSFNRNIPLVIAAGVGVMSGFYIWEPMFKKESKGTWQYEVVQQTREEERNRVADAAASSLANNSTPATSTTSPASTPASSAPEASSRSTTAPSEASPSPSA